MTVRITNRLEFTHRTKRVRITGTNWFITFYPCMSFRYSDCICFPWSKCSDNITFESYDPFCHKNRSVQARCPELYIPKDVNIRRAFDDHCGILCNFHSTYQNVTISPTLYQLKLFATRLTKTTSSCRCDVSGLKVGCIRFFFWVRSEKV